MRRIALLAAVFLLAGAGCLPAAQLQVGMKAPAWSFEDSEGRIYTMDDWAGKVLQVTYVDPDEADLNEHFTDAVKKAKDEGRLKEANFKGIGIADCASSWKPDFAIRAIAGRKAKKYNTVILFDFDGTLRKAWGLKEDSSNVVILDRERVVRAIVRGRVPDDQVENLIQLEESLQNP